MAALNNRLAPALAALLALVTGPLAGCSLLGPPIERPEVALTNIRPLESTVFEQRVETELRIRNPNDVDLDVTGLDVEIAVNGKRLVRVLSSDAVKVPRFGEATVKAVASTSTTAILREVVALQRGGAAVEDPSYSVAGYVYLGGGLRRRVKLEHAGKLLAE